MSERVDDLRRMLGGSRERLGALADRLAGVAARLRAPGPAPTPGAPPPPEPPPLRAADIESLDLKFEAIGVEGSAPEKLPEG